MNYKNILLGTLLLVSSSYAFEMNCISDKDIADLDPRLKAFNKAIDGDDFKSMSSYMGFPLTDNHNHAITKRVFLEELEYEPTVNLRSILKQKFPKQKQGKSTKSYRYLSSCDHYVVEKSYEKGEKGLRFIFKKMGSEVKLKMIRFTH